MVGREKYHGPSWKSTHSPGASVWRMDDVVKSSAARISPKCGGGATNDGYSSPFLSKNLLNLPPGQQGVLFRNNEGGMFKTGSREMAPSFLPSRGAGQQLPWAERSTTCSKQLSWRNDKAHHPASPSMEIGARHRHRGTEANGEHCIDYKCSWPVAITKRASRSVRIPIENAEHTQIRKIQGGFNKRLSTKM